MEDGRRADRHDHFDTLAHEVLRQTGEAVPVGIRKPPLDHHATAWDTAQLRETLFEVPQGPRGRRRGRCHPRVQPANPRYLGLLRLGGVRRSGKRETQARQSDEGPAFHRARDGSCGLATAGIVPPTADCVQVPSSLS